MAYIEEGKAVSPRGDPTSVRGEAAGETGTATRLRPRLEARSPHTPSLCSRGTSCRFLLCFEITQIFLLFFSSATKVWLLCRPTTSVATSKPVSRNQMLDRKSVVEGKRVDLRG